MFEKGNITKIIVVLLKLNFLHTFDLYLIIQANTEETKKKFKNLQWVSKNKRVLCKKSIILYTLGYYEVEENNIFQ